MKCDCPTTVKSSTVNHTGDPIEIILNTDTKIFADITPEPEISDVDLASGSKLVTWTIILGSIELIGDGMILRIWGPIHDGMVIAEILVYESID